MIAALRQELTHAWRSTARSPGVAITATVVLGLGIGATTAVFSIVDGVLLHPLPYREPARLVAVWDRIAKASGTSKIFDSYADFREISAHASAFSIVATATWAVESRLLSGQGPPRSVLAMPVSASFFPLLGVAPARGRVFQEDDDRQGCTIVLSDHLWRQSMRADPTLVGRAITLDDEPCTVVGIMPPGFAFYPETAGLWVLLTPHGAPARDTLPVGIFARLRPGTTIARAQAEVSALHAALHRADGREHDLVPVVYSLQEELTFLAEADLETTLWILAGAVGFVLLIGCFNLATLLLAQALGRERELSVRLALGSGRRRIVRQLLMEAIVLAAIGGAAGIGVAGAAVAAFRAVNPVEMPVGSHVAINPTVLLFALLLSATTVVVFGLVPAWRVSRVDPVQGLKSGGRGSTTMSRRLVGGLITAEMALSLALLVAAGLLIESLFRMGHEPLGFRATGLAVADVRLPVARYPSSAARLQLYERVSGRLGGQAVIATSLPPDGPGITRGLYVQGAPAVDPSDVHRVGHRTVSASYFGELGVRVLRGRAFDVRDRAGSDPVIVINESVARQLFPRVDPIGQMLAVGTPAADNPWRRVVGVVADEKTSSSYHEIGWVERDEVFTPLAQDPPLSAVIAFPGSTTALRRALDGLDAGIAIGEMQTMRERVARLLAYPRFRALLLTAFAAFALLLATVGLSGVLRQFVVERRREISVRIAVGAAPRDIVRLIAVQAGRPVLVGLLGGLAGAVVLGRYLASVLYRVAPGDPTTLAVVSIVLVAAASAAAWLPARRAARVDPVVALRAE